ncbi:MAG: putative nucleotidyltransferase component of viral defense system [Saprospiraceae bacterium]|jgi:predicted nucleotidyltransferase component of viral defense system
MIRFYNIEKEEKKNIYKEVSNRTNMPDYNVEKDWWVAQTLSLVFEMAIGPHLVFKGGTSLSKSWGIISRFSEDVDLAVNRKFLGFEGDLGKNQRTKLRKSSSKYITEEFAPALQKAFQEKGMSDVQINVIATTESDQDPKLVEVYYPHVLAYPDYIKPRILLEIGCRSLIEPYTKREVVSVLDLTFPGSEFVQNPILIPSVNPERTFLEKIFLLHEEFQKEEPRSERMSRHLYDLYKLLQVPQCKIGLQNESLYRTIVAHRKQFTKLKDVDYDRHSPEFINFIPAHDILASYKNDYKVMQESMINEDSPEFEKLIEELESLKQEINQIKFE